MSYRSGMLVLWLALAASGIACVYAKHESRKLFVELQRLEAARDELNIDWGRLQIEQSTWSTHGRVEALAREQLDMSTPGPAELVVVKP
ncbi:MAG TPA: cell division protein FtsL [Gammaproteobacteria bacterium]|nr:cell division protein FtsL [Gammaproteobacteria bacterium]